VDLITSVHCHPIIPQELAPPLCITIEKIEEGLSIISKALQIADKHTYA
jgi:acetylornithine/succinyldiaminopimelate/putrescine aminotransferase